MLQMRIIAAASLTASFLVAPASAEKRTFTVANDPDGYRIDRCLATGAPCGTVVATAYCRARDFDQVLSFRRVDRERDTTLDVAANDAVVAIECSR